MIVKKRIVPKGAYNYNLAFLRRFLLVMSARKKYHYIQEYKKGSQVSGKHQIRSGKGSKKARATAARLSAVQAVYQSIVREQSTKELVKEYMAYRFGEPIDGEKPVLPDSALFSSILNNIEDRRTELENMVIHALSDNKDKHDTADQSDEGAAGANRPEPLLFSILLCGAGELFSHPEIDAPIIISDYLNITHAFYDQGENKLVNAVLDRLQKALRDT